MKQPMPSPPARYFLLVGLLFASLNSLAGSKAQDWAKINTPSAGTAQSIGQYTSGCVSGAQALPLHGTGYQVMRLSRQRYYGHPQLITFIQNLGRFSYEQQLGTLLIGDLGQPRGGPTLSGHRSHQTGLDVDIWFLLSTAANQRLLSAEEREDWNATSMVNLATDSINDNHWSPTHEKILQIAAEQPEVDRIFVNASIKQQLCMHKNPGDTRWLRKIRPWWKHDDHFHVRLHCPADNTHCENQAPLPAGDGCDDSLAWWFSAEAKSPTATGAKPEPPPPLPALCDQVLRQ